MTEDKGQVVNPAGMPEMHPPEGGPNADPNVPDPSQLIPGRPGFPETLEHSDVDEDDEPTRDEPTS